MISFDLRCESVTLTVNQLLPLGIFDNIMGKSCEQRLIMHVSSIGEVYHKNFVIRIDNR